MKTNKRFLINIIKAVYAVTVFAVACLCFSHFLNRDNVDMTTDMAAASLPVVHLKVADYDVNYLYGYLNRMQTGYMRDNLTVVDADRKINYYVDTYGAAINDMSFEVRSMNGDRLVEKTDINYRTPANGFTEGSFTIKDLITDGEEYMLIIVIDTDRYTDICYYTRLIWSENLHVEEKVAYVYDFSNKTFDKTAAKELTKYLESNSSGDNSNYMHTDIHSSFKQVTWGDLSINRFGKPRITISELTPQTGYFKVDYQVGILEESGNAICNVTEYYRIRYTTDRIYLLSWERDLEQIPDLSRDIYAGDQIELGLAGPDIELVESDGGGGFAFSDAGKLIGVNTTDHRVSMIYSFYDDAHDDLRCIHRDHRIHILSVDETGDVEFMVYGYMNRGIHEGHVGISVYKYNSAYNTIEELAYIDYDKSASVLMGNVDELAYTDREGHEYFMLERTVYEIDPVDKTLVTMASNLQDDSYKVSDNGQMLLWQTDGELYSSSKLRIINLSTGLSEDIKAGYGEYIMPLGFMGNDCVYGLAKSRSVKTDIDGTVIFPMYKLIIRSSSGDILKTYSEPDLFVMETEFADGLINLKRASYNEKSDRYEEVADDQIVRTQDDVTPENHIVRVVTESLETVVQISMKTELADDEIIFLTPRETVTEGSNELSGLNEDATINYYVYGLRGYTSGYVEASNAVNEAYEQSGIVIDTSGDYVWYKTTRSGKNQIMAITEPDKTEPEESLASCIDCMLRYEGVTTNSRILLAQGQNAYQIISGFLDNMNVLNLAGCNLNAVLYYVNLDIPVLAINNDGTSYLITGFNDSQIVLYDPVAGELRKESITDMDNEFRASGYHFITYSR